MSARWQLFTRPAPEALERILRTVRARGFLVREFQVLPQVALQDGYRVRLAVDGARDPAPLRRQLEKLWDVEQVLEAVPEGEGRAAVTAEETQVAVA
ncbi:MAG: ACT domain-containing protein [Ectothiorhodospira sp.]